MRTAILNLSLLVGITVVILGSATGTRAAEPDWKAVEQALGKPVSSRRVTSFASGCRAPICR